MYGFLFILLFYKLDFDRVFFFMALDEYEIESVDSFYARVRYESCKIRTEF